MPEPASPTDTPAEHTTQRGAHPSPSQGSDARAAAGPAPAASLTHGSAPTGDGAAQLTWLHEEIGRQLAAYRRRRKRDKRKAFGLQMATVTLSAAITVLLGLRVTGIAQQRLADVALALGAIITVLAAAEAFFGHRGLWVLRTETVRHLEALARDLAYYQAGLNGQPPDPPVVQRYRAKLDRVLAADFTTWQRLRAASTSSTPSADTTETRTIAPSPTGMPPNA
jgi:hypothetical protein